MTIKEYGRNVHNMVSYLMKIEDKETRQKNAEAIIEVMAVLSPQLKDIEDYRHKLWDHLYLMTDYKLEVDCPYPVPTQEAKEKKPDPLHYPKTKIKWNHFGKKFEDLYNKAIEEVDEEKKQGYVSVLTLFMKVAYNNWHGENVHDDMIKDELFAMSKGKLVHDPSKKFTEFVDIVDHTIHPEMQRGVKRHFVASNASNNRNNNARNNNRPQNNNNNRPQNNKFNRFKKKNNNNML
jgi:hypothetical protein